MENALKTLGKVAIQLHCANIFGVKYAFRRTVRQFTAPAGFSTTA
jgi:hypothetical protein